jgi:hypothetical protein
LALLRAVGDIARQRGYSATPPPDTIEDAWRMLVQLARDYDAEISTERLSSKKVPNLLSTLGDATFVVYLRSFDAPATVGVVPTDWGKLSLEELLAFYLELSGKPLIGLGRHEKMTFGAGRPRALTTTGSWHCGSSR